MFSWYTYLSVILVFFPPLGLWSGNIFLIALFPDHCLLVPFPTSNSDGAQAILPVRLILVSLP